MSLNCASFTCAVLAAVWIVAGAFPAPPAANKSLGDLTGPWQLFVDDYLLTEKENVARTYHAFEKYRQNPVMTADRAWEGSTVYVYGSVLPAEDGRGYRMWYHSWSAGEYRILYATSRDGITWEKPDLGLVNDGGSTTNNRLLRRTHEDHNPQVIHTPWEADPQRRYKLINFDYGRTPPDHTVTGYYGAWSADGIHWIDAPKNPVLVDSPGDVGNFVWDPHKRRYLGCPKKFAEVRGFHRRCVGFSATTDFESWPATRLILTPDEFDDRWVTATPAGQHTDFYGLCGFAYESMYLGFLWIFRITDGNNDGRIFVELVSSRDGEHWTRQEPPRPPILPLGPHDAWDSGMVFTTNHPLVENGVIKLYYGGFNVTHAVDGGAAAIGLATLRKDGFVSLDAGNTEGSITTKKLTGCRGPLRLNYSAPGGSIRVEVLDVNGAPLPGYGREECVPLSGDHVDQQVTWSKTDQLPDRSEPFRIRFLLRNASLYSFAAGDSVSAGN
jgi:hypothetical protein